MKILIMLVLIALMMSCTAVEDKPKRKSKKSKKAKTVVVIPKPEARALIFHYLPDGTVEQYIVHGDWYVYSGGNLKFDFNDKEIIIRGHYKVEEVKK